MNTKLTVLFAAMAVSASVFAQTQPMPSSAKDGATPQTQSASGTSNTGMSTAGQSTSASGEQNATGMQNNSNAQKLPQKNKANQGKANKSDKTKKADCTMAHTDGHSTTAATAADSQMAAADCNPTTPTQR